MKNIFGLRFRRRKLVATFSVALAFLMAGATIFQATAAEPVNLDVDQQVRLVGGPNSPTTYQNQVTAEHGNVAQVSMIVHNTEDAYNGPTAQNFKLKLTIPKGPSTSLQNKAQVSASNAQSNPIFRTVDTSVINSKDGSSLTLNKPRFFQIHRNNLANDKCNDPSLDWKVPTDLPASNYQIEEQANQFVVTVDPYGTDSLKPSWCDAFKVTYLVDVTGEVPGPQLQLEKKVRMAGQTNFVDANQAQAGQKLQYFVELKNISQANATNVILRDALPANVTLIPGSVSVRTSADPTLKPGPDNFVNGGLSYPSFGAGAWVQVYFNAQIGEITDCPYWFKNFALVKSDQTEGSEYFDSVKTDLECQPSPTPTPTATPTVTPTPTPTPTPPVTPKQGKLLIVKFEDLNGNGTEDPGEPRLGGVTFFVGMLGVEFGDDGVIETASPSPVATANGDGQTGPDAASQHATDGNGEILLSDLEPGTYRAEEQVPNGFNPTTPTTQQAEVTDESTAVLKFGNQRIQKKVPPQPVPPQAQVKGALPVTGTPGAAMLALAAIAGSTYLYRRERNALRKTIRNQSVEG